MKKVLFVENLNDLKRNLSVININSVHLLQIEYSQHSQEIKDFLLKNYKSISIVDEAKYIVNFERKYADFIGKINAKNHSLYWWALNLTNKNPITTRLCHCVYYSVMIKKLIDNNEFETLVIISSEKEIFQQAKLLNKAKQEIKFIFASGKKEWWKFVKNIFPIALCYKFILNIVNKIQASKYLSKPVLNNNSLSVVMSLLYKPSFNGDKYQDVYFGKFAEYLHSKKIPFINLMEVCAPYATMMKKTKKYAKWPVYPKEYFISYKNIFKSFIGALQKFFGGYRVDITESIEGEDVTYLLKIYIRYEITSTRFLSNLLIYYSLEKVSRFNNIKTFYYPFENRSFEKMMIMALRKFSPDTKIVGYQHSTISLRHTNFLLERSESEVVPLPDTIVTLGSVSKDFLVDIGNFPEGKLTEGCALRQAPYRKQLKTRSKKIVNIFVALATDIEEYVKVIQFLEDAYEGMDGYNIWIRPHPVFPLEEALAITGKPKFSFHKADQETLDQCLQWADVVLFVHSTVAVEGLACGIPAVQLNIKNMLNPDPLYGFHDFKWEAKMPDELKEIINEIDLLSEKDYVRRQLKGKEIALLYTCETTEEKLEELCHV